MANDKWSGGGWFAWLRAHCTGDDDDNLAADLLEADAAELARCTVMIAERDNRIEILERAALAFPLKEDKGEGK